MPQTWMIVDGNSLLHRAFYAMPELTSTSGQPTGAVQGFLNMLLRLCQEEHPTALAIAFDSPGATFRHEKFQEYKAGRKRTPDALVAQFGILRELLSAMGIAIVSLPCYEADDILGTLAHRAQSAGAACVLVTGDRDALQLVAKDTRIIFTQKGISQTTVFTPALLREKYGVDPQGFIDLKALMGDKSDNIPGIPGIGEKKAAKLLDQFGTLENLLDHPAEIASNSDRAKVEQFADQARLSKWLATIDRDIPLHPSADDLAFDWAKVGAGIPALLRYDLNAISGRLAKLTNQAPLDSSASPDAPAAAPLPTPARITDAVALAALLPRCQAGYVLSLAPDCTLAGDFGAYQLGQPPTLLEQGFTEEQILPMLAPTLSDVTVPKVTHDGKALLHTCADAGIDLQNIDFDTALAAYLLDSTQGEAGVPALCEKYLARSGEGAAAIWALRPVLETQLERDGMTRLFREIELPLMRVLYDMERLGFALDACALREMGATMEQEIATLTASIYSLAGREFNIKSPRQLGEILFDSLGLPAVKKTKTGYSTDIEVLESLYDAHPIVGEVIAYRQITKLKSTYIDGLLAALRQPEGRVHTQFKQTLTATGRISSVEPNLQNIPVRTQQGREIRKAFVAGQPDWVLVGADYSQIELRVLAHFANDPVLLDAFHKGQDIHARTAAEVLGIPLDEVTPAQRANAKAVNFGIVYGISDFGLARNTGLSRKQAKDYIQTYLTRYAGVQQYMHDVVEQGKRDGYVSTLLGRRRYLRELRSRSYQTRAFGERVALNAPIQGTAADIIKMAMVAVWRQLHAQGMQARMVLQIHDEILVEAPAAEAPAVAELLRREMGSVVQLRVPLEVDVKWGARWYDTK